MIVSANMRLHRQRRHHRHDVQEQSHIRNERIRHLLAKEDFKVGPQNLNAKPHSAAQRHKGPEKLRLLIGSFYI